MFHYLAIFSIVALCWTLIYIQGKGKSMPVLTCIILMALISLASGTRANASEVPHGHHRHIQHRKVHHTPAISRPMTPAEQKAFQRTCVARAVYKEARGQSAAGKAAVAYVITTRVEKSKEAATPCSIVYKTDIVKHKRIRQFSWTGKKIHIRSDDPAWIESQMIALLVMEKAIPNPAPGAMYFHARYVKVRMAKYHRRVDGQIFESDSPFPPS